MLLMGTTTSYFLENLENSEVAFMEDQLLHVLSCWTRIYPAFPNSVDPDQLASSTALFAIKYVNL